TLRLALARDPEKRRAVEFDAQTRLRALQHTWDAGGFTPKGDRIVPIAEQRSAKELDKEQAVRQAFRTKELTEEGMKKLMPETVQAAERGAQKIAEHPLIARLLEDGRLMSRTQAEAEGRKSEYDDAPWLPSQLYGGSIMPDEAAQILHDAGMIPDATP